MKHLVLVPAVFLLALALHISPIFAQSTYIQQNIRSTGPEEVKVEIRQEVNSGGQVQSNFRRVQGSPVLFEAECASIIARINARVGFYNERRDSHLKHYQNLKARLENLVAKLDERGFDTTEIKENLQELDRLVTVASVSYADFIAKLEATKNYDCGNGSGEFRAALEESKAALETFQANLKAIREHVQGDLKDSLQALKDQRPIQE